MARLSRNGRLSPGHLCAWSVPGSDRTCRSRRERQGIFVRARTSAAVRPRAIVRLVALGASLAWACGRAGEPDPGDEGTALAIVGDRAILASDLTRTESAQDRRRAVDSIVARILTSQEATRRGLAETELVARRVGALRRAAAAQEEALLRDALFESIRDALAPTEADLRRHYEANKLRYAEREVTLRWWPLGRQEAASAASTKSVPKVVLDAAEAETIGPISLRALPAKVVPEVFHLTKPGDRLAAGSESEGFGVVELVEVLPAVPQPLEAVRDRVEESWRTLEGQRAFAKLMAELREKADVEIDESALANDALWTQPAK
ncbi:MAG TPA: peptidylprolyl isomerase [Myxococcota bacterium]|nr:peptidylprolyl isomerase [Myxococcota bacterium]